MAGRSRFETIGNQGDYKPGEFGPRLAPDPDLPGGDLHQPFLPHHLQAGRVLSGRPDPAGLYTVSQQVGHCHLDVGGAQCVSAKNCRTIYHKPIVERNFLLQIEVALADPDSGLQLL